MQFPHKRQLASGIAALLIAVIFIFFPRPASALYLRITFEQFEGDGCSLYYTTDTDGNFSQDKCIISEIDPDTMQVSFRLDGMFDGHLTGLRLDFPHTEQLAEIKTVTVSSAGVIQREYNPCSFFAPENIQASHNADVTLVHPKNRVYVSAGADDPYLILSHGLTSQITACYSHQTLTRLLLCIFIACSFYLSRRKIFTASGKKSDRIAKAA